MIHGPKGGTYSAVEISAGQRFGRLVAIERAESRRYKVYWRFRCDCGTVKEIRLADAVSGASPSCGCRHRADLEYLNRLADGRAARLRA